MTVRGRIAPSVLAIALVASAGTASDAAELRDELKAWLDGARAAAEFPGATFGLAGKGGVRIGLATGFAGGEGTAPLAPDALMPSGSCGKTYFAALALRRAGAGELDLDAKLERYLGQEPWLPELRHSERMTVRMLLNHTSGLERYELDPRFTADLRAQPDRSWSVADRLAYVAGRAPPFEPGQGWVYSDTNYIVLGAALETLHDRPLYDEIRAGLLEPLALRHTVPHDRRVVPGLVQGHAGEADPFSPKDEVLEDGAFFVNPQFEWAGGGFASSAEDLAAWCRAYFRGEAFPATLLPQVLDGVKSTLGPNVRYGLGAILWVTPNGPAYGHSGFFPGYLAEMRYYEALDVAVAIQINTSVFRSVGSPLGKLLDEAAHIAAEHEE